MGLIKDIMSTGLVVIAPTSTMADAQKLMLAHGFRHLPVHDGKTIIGMISDRDVQRSMSIVNIGETLKDTHISHLKLVSDYMTTPVKRIHQNENIRKVAQEMLNLKVSCFVVVDDKQLDIGIVTTEDLLILLIDKLDSEVSFLQKIAAIFSPKGT